MQISGPCCDLRNMLQDVEIGKIEKKRENTNLAENGQNEKSRETSIPGTKDSWRGQKAGPSWNHPGWPILVFAGGLRNLGLACMEPRDRVFSAHAGGSGQEELPNPSQVGQISEISWPVGDWPRESPARDVL